MDRMHKLFLLLLLIIGFLIANHFTELFLWNAIMRNKSMLTFSFFCVLLWEVLRTAISSNN